ncbi:MAG: hypothetical protein LAO05_17740 [Acidobacteriia bacterium]|nr:hypothetical protein [Terriglobia bacterium]
MGAGIRRVARHVLGWGFLVLGVAGLVLPILQGWLFIAIGALLLSPDVPLFGRLLRWVEEHFPLLRPHLHRARRRVSGSEDPPAAPPDGP